jgi:hypothetical protein
MEQKFNSGIDVSSSATFRGTTTLASDPALPLQAATMQYVDNKTIFSDTVPTGVSAGQRWMDTINGIEYTWFVDADSGQWVEFKDSLLGAFAPIDGGSVTDTYVGTPYSFDGGSI